MAKSPRKHEPEAKRRHRGPKNKPTDELYGYRAGKPIIDKPARVNQRARLRREYL